jgi:glycosyltransferase involved in cell wall biosynthesis
MVSIANGRCAVHTAPILRQDVRQQLLALEEGRLLYAGVSCLVYDASGVLARGLGWLDRCFGAHLTDRTRSRQMPGPLARRMESYIWAELIRRCGTNGSRSADAWLQAVDRAAAHHVRNQTRVVLAGEDACLATFAAARAVGAMCLYDLPVPYYATLRAILAREREEFPDVVGEFFQLDADYHPARCRRKQQELQAADHVVVASRFVLNSLRHANYPVEQVSVIPYGSDPGESRVPHRDNARPGSNVVLYVGHVSLRKGIPRLLRVWKRLGAHRTHRLRLIGQMHLPAKFLTDYAGLFEHVPPLPRPHLWDHYAAATVFVFPSAGDGFGQVINEAMSCGVPVVASTHTGAPGYITDGQEGLIYPFGDDDALAAALDRILSQPTEAAAMGRAAFHLAHRWTWTEYRAAFRDLVVHLLRAFGNNDGTA